MRAQSKNVSKNCFKSEIETDLQNNTKFFWKFVNKRGGKGIPYSMFLNAVKADMEQNIVDLFANTSQMYMIKLPKYEIKNSVNVRITTVTLQMFLIKSHI